MELIFRDLVDLDRTVVPALLRAAGARRKWMLSGDIGAGKTTLCTKLGKSFGCDIHYESTDDNPYLSDFYEDMKRWSFNLQIFFLNSRYKQILDIQNGPKTVIQDRTI